MVISQTLNRTLTAADEVRAKAEIKKVEAANKTIRKAIKAKVTASKAKTNKDIAKAREKAISREINDNPAFFNAVQSSLFALLGR
jgi:hypothetical protein